MPNASVEVYDGEPDAGVKLYVIPAGGLGAIESVTGTVVPVVKLTLTV